MVLVRYGCNHARVVAKHGRRPWKFLGPPAGAAVDLLVEIRIFDMKLPRIDADNWTCSSSAHPLHLRRGKEGS